MSVKLSRKPFGNYTLFTLGDDRTQISFIPERSAYIHQIKLNGIDILWNYASEEELTGNSGYRNLALLPFPNRLLEGQYEWNGNFHAFKIDDPYSRSALHGFGPNALFNVERYDLSLGKASVKLTYLHRAEEHPESYPFLVRFDVVLEVDINAHTAKWELCATNLGDFSAPVGLGWHPYFLMPGGYQKWSLQMPANEQVVLAKAIPNGERGKGLLVTPINTEWDDCFALTDSEDLEVKLLGPVYSLSLKQLGTTRYTQLYVPADNASIAIEPMSCGVNAFNISKEEVELAPKQWAGIGMEISILGI